MNGIVVKAISGFYYVYSDKTTYECKARGSFRNSGASPVVGDYVDFSVLSDKNGVIESIHPRKNFLDRPLIANIDRIFIVSAFKTPSPDTYLIDLMSAICIYKKIEPVIVFNKSDMGSFEKFEKIYRNSGLKTLTVSAKNNDNTESLSGFTAGKVCAFIGNSGVGKSSLINALNADLMLKTGEVSEKLGRGRHTTRHTELFIRENGAFIVDTPGFSSLDISDDPLGFRDNLPLCFPEFKEYLGLCRFSDCTHTTEPKCSIAEAVKNGKIEASRFESYKKIFADLKDFKSWNLK